MSGAQQEKQEVWEVFSLPATYKLVETQSSAFGSQEKPCSITGCPGGLILLFVTVKNILMQKYRDVESLILK